MSEMGEGFDKLVSKLQQAVNFAEKLDKTFGNISRNAGAAGNAIAGGASGGGAGGHNGGHMNNGGGKNVMANSFGSSPYNSPRLDKTNPKFVSQADRTHLSDIGSPTMDNGKQAFGKMGKAMGRMTGMAQFTYDPNGGSGQILAMQEQKRANQARMDQAKSRYMGMHGVSMSRFSTLSPESQANIQSSMYGLGDSLSLMSGLSNAAQTMMPSVQATMDRVAGYYNAGVMGGRTRDAVQNNTFSTLSKMGGMTSVGSDAAVAQYLTSRGMSPNGGAGSTYQETLRSVANAGRYLNISNEDAAKSIEGLTSAGGAASTLQNFGIYTADLKTGKEKTQGQIFEEVAQRLTAGRGQASLAQTQASIRRGALGVTADAFFKDETTNKMFKQYMVDRAQGKNMDLSSSSPLGGNVGESAANPLLSQMTMNASDTGVMNAAQGNYIKGINTATKALQMLNGVVAGLSSTFAGAGSAMTQTLFGAGSVKGIAGGMSTMVNFAGKAAAGIGQAFMGMDALNPAPALTEMGIIAGSAGASMAVGLGTMAAAGLGAVGFGGGSGGGSGRMSNGGANGGGIGPNDGGSTVNWADIAAGMNTGTATTNLFSMANLTSHGINRGTTGGHKGYDYAYHYGDPVYAIGDGKVIEAVNSYNKQDYATSWDNVGDHIGNYVAILHTAADGSQYTSLYGHLSKVSVSKKQSVSKGQKIGEAGNTGSTWPMEQNGDGGGSHLHFELQKGEKHITGLAKSLDPTAYESVLENKANAYMPLASNSPGLSAVAGGTPAAANSYTDSGTPQGPMSTQGDAAASAVAGASATASGMINKIQGSVSGAMGILANLYSNNPDKLTSAVNAMAANYGMTADQLAYYSQPGAAGTYLPASGAPGGGVLKPGNNGNNGQPVNITVQVPDVTAADAVKFAQLVKQYLDDSSLLSNMGSN